MRLLILACSSTKRPEPGLLPAFERYDGPAWRVLRAALRSHPPLGASLDVYALSAAFGLIPAAQPIPDYNLQLDVRRADALRPVVTLALDRVLWRGTLLWGGYRSTLICGARLYQSLLPDPLPSSCGGVTRTSGGIGRQLHQLKAWLEQGS